MAIGLTLLRPDLRRLARLSGRVSPRTVVNGLEILLLILIGLQLARFLWAIAAPVGPLGDWRPPVVAQPAADPRLLTSFDAFFRTGGDGAMQVSTLDLDLFGTRVDPVGGRGAAIIGGSDGVQASYLVGEEVRPGVVLQAVAEDHVTLSRGGVSEQLFLDQSVGGPAPAAAAPSSSAPSAAGAGAGVDPRALVAQTALMPRMKGSTVTGYAIQPQGAGDVFGRAGFLAGDVLVSVNGMRMTSPDSLAALASRLGESPEAVVEVERGGRIVTLSVPVSK